MYSRAAMIPRPVVVSAPGKVLLHGEHAVVYGKVALAMSLDLRCFFLLLPREDGLVHLALPDLHLEKTWRLTELADMVGLQENVQLEAIKRLGDPGDETEGGLSTKSLATVAFLYLLVHICASHLRDIPGLDVTVVSTLPAGAGLGSSAAYSVCLAAGLLSTTGTIGCDDKEGKTSCDRPPGVSDRAATDRECGAPLLRDDSSECVGDLPPIIKDKLAEVGYGVGGADGGCGLGWRQEELRAVNEWGFRAERLIHGTPSGIDNSISTFGHALSFRNGTVTPLTSVPQIEILLVNTKVPRNTKKMVDGVREKYHRLPSVVAPLFDSIEAIALASQKHLEELITVKDTLEKQKIFSKLQELMILNQHLLNAIGVGHPTLDRMCAIASAFGLAAKLTGAGGGGCGVVLLPPEFADSKLEEMQAAFTAAGFSSWKAIIGSRGVTQHHVSKVTVVKHF